MDSKIIVAIIIGASLLASVYMYTSTTPFSRCMSVYMDMSKDGMQMDATGALSSCSALVIK